MELIPGAKLRGVIPQLAAGFIPVVIKYFLLLN
jgi:hypothetical protein